MRPARSLRLGVTSLVLAAAIAGGGLAWDWYADAQQTAAIFGPDAIDVQGRSHLRPGQTFDWSVTFVTGNLTRMPVTLEGATFPNGLPAHLHRVHEGIMLRYGYAGATGWPPHIDHVRYPQHALPGYRLATPAGTQVVISEGVVADRPGIYVLGPLKVRFAVAHPILGPILLRHATKTVPMYAVACYTTHDAACDAAVQRVTKRF